MKVEISKEGKIVVTAETIAEAYAMNYIAKIHRGESFTVIDCTILKQTKGEYTKELQEMFDAI